MSTESVLLSLFPFGVIFGTDLTVLAMGNSLAERYPSAIGRGLTELLTLERPCLDRTFSIEDVRGTHV